MHRPSTADTMNNVSIPRVCQIQPPKRAMHFFAFFGMIRVKEYIYIFLTILKEDEKEKNDEKTVDFCARGGVAALLLA